MRLKTVLLNTIRIIFTIVFLLYLLKKIDVEKALVVLKKANSFYLILSLLLFFCFFAALSIRWKILLKAQNMNFTFSYLFISYIVSHFFNNIFPTTIGGDVIRVIDTGKQEGKAKSFAVVFADRMTGFIGLFMMVTFISLIFFPTNIFIITFSITGFSIALGIILVFSSYRLYDFFKKVFKKIRVLNLGDRLIRTHDYFLLFKNKKRYLVASTFISILIQVNISAMWYLLFISVGGNTPFLNFLVITPVVNTISMLPITIGGLGLRETTFVELLSRYGVIKEIAFSTSILFLFFYVAFGLLGGIIFLIRKNL